jgi:hypothetical protein
VNINRDTVGNVSRAGLAIESEDSFMMSIVRILRARPGETEAKSKEHRA